MKDSLPKLRTLYPSPLIVVVNSHICCLNYVMLRCQPHSILLLRLWSFVSTGETSIHDAALIFFNVVLTREREMPEVFVQ